MAVRPASIARPAPLAGKPFTLRGVLEREGTFSWLMLSPGVLFLLAFVAYPFFYGIFLSLEDRPVARPGVFIGLANFATLLHDGVFWQVTRNTFLYTTVTTVLKVIGGLGMGFTLRAALAVLGPEARIMVAELVPAVIAWARGPMADVFGDSLNDPRVNIREADVVDVIRSHASAFDAILLDVDNGPEGLIREANDVLYDLRGLKAIRRALRPGGMLAVWSSGPHPAFTRRLRDAGFVVNEVAVRATTRRSGARHVIWFATKSGGGR